MIIWHKYLIRTLFLRILKGFFKMVIFKTDTRIMEQSDRHLESGRPVPLQPIPEQAERAGAGAPQASLMGCGTQTGRCCCQ